MEGDTASTNTSNDDKTDDYCDNPTRDTLADGLMCLLKPTVDQLDERVRATRISQNEVKQHLDNLSEELKKISDAQQCPVDLDLYVQKLNNAKQKITIVSTFLNTAQILLQHGSFYWIKLQSTLILKHSDPAMTNILVTPDLTHFSGEDYNSVYEPAEDSFLFLDALEEDINVLKILNPSVCLEIGCGSGVVSTSLAKHFQSSCFVVASDINPSACEASLKTSSCNGTHVEVVTADLVSHVRPGLVELLLFNPPYVVTPSEEVISSRGSNLLHRAWAGGKRGREVTDRLLPLIKTFLSDRALFYLVVIEENDPDDIHTIMTKNGFETCIVKSRKVRGEHLSVMRFSRGM